VTAQALTTFDKISSLGRFALHPQGKTDGKLFIEVNGQSKSNGKSNGNGHDIKNGSNGNGHANGHANGSAKVDGYDESNGKGHTNGHTESRRNGVTHANS
jgi:hypothetical protein